MKKFSAGIAIIFATMIFMQCNNSATPESSTDTMATHTDTSKLPVVTEGGLRDSIQIGASDTTKVKDSVKK